MASKIDWTIKNKNGRFCLKTNLQPDDFGVQQFEYPPGGVSFEENQAKRTDATDDVYARALSIFKSTLDNDGSFVENANMSLYMARGLLRCLKDETFVTTCVYTSYGSTGPLYQSYPYSNAGKWYAIALCEIGDAEKQLLATNAKEAFARSVKGAFVQQSIGNEDRVYNMLNNYKGSFSYSAIYDALTNNGTADVGENMLVGVLKPIERGTQYEGLTLTKKPSKGSSAKRRSTENYYLLNKEVQLCKKHAFLAQLGEPMHLYGKYCYNAKKNEHFIKVLTVSGDIGKYIDCQIVINEFHFTVIDAGKKSEKQVLYLEPEFLDNPTIGSNDKWELVSAALNLNKRHATGSELKKAKQAFSDQGIEPWEYEFNAMYKNLKFFSTEVDDIQKSQLTSRRRFMFKDPPTLLEIAAAGDGNEVILSETSGENLRNQDHPNPPNPTAVKIVHVEYLSMIRARKSQLKTLQNIRKGIQECQTAVDNYKPAGWDNLFGQVAEEEYKDDNATDYDLGELVIENNLGKKSNRALITNLKEIMSKFIPSESAEIKQRFNLIDSGNDSITSFRRLTKEIATIESDIANLPEDSNKEKQEQKAEKKLMIKAQEKATRLAGKAAREFYTAVTSFGDFFGRPQALVEEVLFEIERELSCSVDQILHLYAFERIHEDLGVLHRILVERAKAQQQELPPNHTIRRQLYELEQAYSNALKKGSLEEQTARQLHFNFLFILCYHNFGVKFSGSEDEPAYPTEILPSATFYTDDLDNLLRYQERVNSLLMPLPAGAKAVRKRKSQVASTVYALLGQDTSKYEPKLSKYELELVQIITKDFDKIKAETLPFRSKDELLLSTDEMVALSFANFAEDTFAGRAIKALGGGYFNCGPNARLIEKPGCVSKKFVHIVAQAAYEKAKASPFISESFYLDESANIVNRLTAAGNWTRQVVGSGYLKSTFNLAEVEEENDDGEVQLNGKQYVLSEMLTQSERELCSNLTMLTDQRADQDEDKDDRIDLANNIENCLCALFSYSDAEWWTTSLKCVKIGNATVYDIVYANGSQDNKIIEASYSAQARTAKNGGSRISKRTNFNKIGGTDLKNYENDVYNAFTEIDNLRQVTTYYTTTKTGMFVNFIFDKLLTMALEIYCKTLETRARKQQLTQNKNLAENRVAIRSFLHPITKSVDLVVPWGLYLLETYFMHRFSGTTLFFNHWSSALGLKSKDKQPVTLPLEMSTIEKVNAYDNEKAMAVFANALFREIWTRVESSFYDAEDDEYDAKAIVPLLRLFIGDVIARFESFSNVSHSAVGFSEKEKAAGLALTFYYMSILRQLWTLKVEKDVKTDDTGDDADYVNKAAAADKTVSSSLEFTTPFRFDNLEVAGNTISRRIDRNDRELMEFLDNAAEGNTFKVQYSGESKYLTLEQKFESHKDEDKEAFYKGDVNEEEEPMINFKFKSLKDGEPVLPKTPHHIWVTKRRERAETRTVLDKEGGTDEKGAPEGKDVHKIRLKNAHRVFKKLICEALVYFQALRSENRSYVEIIRLFGDENDSFLKTSDVLMPDTDEIKRIVYVNKTKRERTEMVDLTREFFSQWEAHEWFKLSIDTFDKLRDYLKKKMERSVARDWREALNFLLILRQEFPTEMFPKVTNEMLIEAVTSKINIESEDKPFWKIEPEGNDDEEILDNILEKLILIIERKRKKDVGNFDKIIDHYIRRAETFCVHTADSKKIQRFVNKFFGPDNNRKKTKKENSITAANRVGVTTLDGITYSPRVSAVERIRPVSPPLKEFEEDNGSLADETSFAALLSLLASSKKGKS